MKERCIFCDIIRQETAPATRLVTETERFAVLEPYAPRFPFETWILPKQHESHFEDADAPTLARHGVGAALHHAEDSIKCWNGRRTISSFTARRCRSRRWTHYHWHLEIIPKLTKVAGFEWGTGFYINPTPPEESARFLREAGSGLGCARHVRSGIKR